MRSINPCGRLVIANLVALATLTHYAVRSDAAVQLSLSGSHSDSNAGLQKVESGGVGAGLSVDLGTHFRLGFTHRQQMSNTYGYLYNEEETEVEKKYPEYYSKSHVISNSVDLTIILYSGEIFTPYIFAGFGVKTYDIETREQFKETSKDQVSLPTPNGGVGLSIKLNQRFSLKMFHTVSLGVKKLPDQEAEQTTDSFSQLGIEYTL